MGEKIHQNVMMQTRQVQHKLKPESKCLRLIWGRFSTCCLWLLAPSILVVSLASYHWETPLNSTQHKLRGCLWLICGRLSTCCLRFLAPSISPISMVSLMSYQGKAHWETFLWVCQGRDVPGSAVRVDAAYERECWESPARMPRAHAWAFAPGRNTWGATA